MSRGAGFVCPNCGSVDNGRVTWTDSIADDGSAYRHPRCDGCGSTAITKVTPHYNNPRNGPTANYPCPRMHYTDMLGWTGNARDSQGCYDPRMFSRITLHLARDAWSAYVMNKPPPVSLCERLDGSADDHVCRFFVDYDGVRSGDTSTDAMDEDVLRVVKAFQNAIAVTYRCADEGEAIQKCVVLRSPFKTREDGSVKFGAHLIFPELLVEAAVVGPILAAMAKSDLGRTYPDVEWDGIDGAVYPNPNLRMMGTWKSVACGACLALQSAHRFAHDLLKRRSCTPDTIDKVYKARTWKGVGAFASSTDLENWVHATVLPLQTVSVGEITNRMRVCPMCDGTSKLLTDSRYFVDTVVGAGQVVLQDDMDMCYTRRYHALVQSGDAIVHDAGFEAEFIRRWRNSLYLSSIRAPMKNPQATPGFVKPAGVQPDELRPIPVMATMFSGDSIGPALAECEGGTHTVFEEPPMANERGFKTMATRTYDLSMLGKMTGYPNRPFPFPFIPRAVWERNYALIVSKAPDEWPPIEPRSAAFWPTMKRLAVLQAMQKTWRKHDSTNYSRIMVKDVKISKSAKTSTLVATADASCEGCKFCPNINAHHSQSTVYLCATLHKRSMSWTYRIKCRCGNDNAGVALVRQDGRQHSCSDWNAQTRARPLSQSASDLLTHLLEPLSEESKSSDPSERASKKARR